MHMKPGESWMAYYKRYAEASNRGKLKRECTWKPVQEEIVYVIKGKHYRKYGIRNAIGNHFSRVNINGETWWIRNDKLKVAGKLSKLPASPWPSSPAHTECGSSTVLAKS